METRWRRWLGPGVIALVAVASVASTTLGAASKPWQPAACDDTAGARTAAATSALPPDLSTVRFEAWFRLDPLLDGRGALQGQRLAVGLDGEQTSRILDVPPESFAAGPFGRVVLVGTDDGTGSRLEALNVEAQCVWRVAEEATVIRRATIDPTGRTVYEFHVDRATRQDLGVWARPLDGSLAAVQVLGPIDPDDRFGRTYATEFSWDLTGSKLAVSSCGEAACRTRVFDPATGTVQSIDEPDLGPLVGLAGDVIVTYGACPGLPCPLLATAIDTGERSVLSDSGAVAVLVETDDGPRLVLEEGARAGMALRSVSLDRPSVTDLGPIAGGLRLHPAQTLADAGTDLPPGWVLLSQDGRIPATGPESGTQLRNVLDGRTLPFQETSR